MFGSLDPAKLLVVLVVALIVVGPERLPRLAHQLGKAWRTLTELRERVTEEVRSAIPDLGLGDLDLPRIPRNPAGAVSSFVRDLTGPITKTGPRSPAQGDAVPLGRRLSPTAASALAPGDAQPEGSSLVVVDARSGALGACFDDPSMN